MVSALQKTKSYTSTDILLTTVRSVLTSVSRLDSWIRNHGLCQVEMRVQVGVVFLSGTGVGAMEENVAIVIIERELPAVQGTLHRGLKEWAEHPVGCGGTKDGVHDQGT